jgi:hypothetical protein
VELYPTLEIARATPRTEAFLSHNSIPIQFTEEDFDQVLSGNFVTKVIYLPDPEFQELALAGVETLVSTRLDPGVDPIVEADRRGAILAIIRLGNLDVEMPGSQDENNLVSPVGHTVPGGYVSYPGQGGVWGGVANGSAGPTPAGYVSGVTTPGFGMPISGTPIGLPGPPHIPHGKPAGLQKHVMKNHTRMHLPDPSKRIRIDVKQRPGFSYPHPATRVRIHEQNIAPSPLYHQPWGNRHAYIR